MTVVLILIYIALFIANLFLIKYIYHIKNSDGSVDEWNGVAMAVVFVYVLFWPVFWTLAVVLTPIILLIGWFKKQRDH